jgi:hypothetical protein
VVCRFC